MNKINRINSIIEIESDEQTVTLHQEQGPVQLTSLSMMLCIRHMESKN